MQVHAVAEGPDDARLWSIEGHLDAWPPWQIDRLPSERKPGEDAGVAAAKERPGSAIALVGGATPLARFFESGSWKSDTETVDGVRATKLSSIAAAALSPETLIAFTIGEGRDERAGLPTIYKATRSFDPELVNADAHAKREYVGTLVTLDGRMVTVNDDDAFPLPSALKTTQGQQFIGPHERFTVVELNDIDDGNGVKCLAAFRAHNGQFVSADRGGDRFLAATRSQRGPWETFILYDMADPGQHSWISTLTGRMWSVEPGGNEFLIANRSEAREWETVFVVGSLGSRLICARGTGRRWAGTPRWRGDRPRPRPGVPLRRARGRGPDARHAPRARVRAPDPLVRPGHHPARRGQRLAPPRPQRVEPLRRPRRAATRVRGLRRPPGRARGRLRATCRRSPCTASRTRPTSRASR